jgi:hypothetical protein
MPLPPSASDTARRKALRVLYADRVVQETALAYGLRNSIAWEGEPGLRAGTNRIYGEYEGGMLETTESERASYVASVPNPTVDSTVPDPPSNLSATPYYQKLLVFFSRPGNVSADTSISYNVIASDGTNTFTNSGSSSPIMITGITNGTTYSVSVTATTDIGTSDAAVLNSVGTSYSPTIFTTVGSTSWTAPIGITSVEYLVVGGGAGSGGGYDTGGGGGGGGGMVLTGSTTVFPETSYSVVVGNGGLAGTVDRLIPSETPGGQGDSSQFDSIIALGGEGGFGSRLPSGSVNGNGGSAAINPLTAANGGNGGGSNGGGGGGGGSSGSGGNKSGTTGGSGGAGTSSDLTGSTLIYGVGGAGASGSSNNNAVAGTQFRGNGARGGGAAAGSQRSGAAGGSGIVILRF